MSYTFARENFEATYPEIEPLYRQHYKEMSDRLSEQGVELAPYAPRLKEYCAYGNTDFLMTLILRHEGKAVGYCNVYVTTDMHNGEIIATEDTLFVTKEHRNGVGKKLVAFALSELKKRNVKRLLVSANTDLRVAKLWGRMGFKEIATQMAYTF